MNDLASCPQICFKFIGEYSVLFLFFHKVFPDRWIVNINEKLGAWGCSCLFYRCESCLGTEWLIRTEGKKRVGFVEGREGGRGDTRKEIKGKMNESERKTSIFVCMNFSSLLRDNS